MNKRKITDFVASYDINCLYPEKLNFNAMIVVPNYVYLCSPAPGRYAINTIDADVKAWIEQHDSSLFEIVKLRTFIEQYILSEELYLLLVLKYS